MFFLWSGILILNKCAFEDLPKPSGDVSPVCWSLMAGIIIAWGVSLKWLSGRLDKKEGELKEEQARGRQDRKDFEAQSNVMLKNLYRKKGEAANDS